jgi:hypothetical protein
MARSIFSLLLAPKPFGHMGGIESHGRAKNQNHRRLFIPASNSRGCSCSTHAWAIGALYHDGS